MYIFRKVIHYCINPFNISKIINYKWFSLEHNLSCDWKVGSEKGISLQSKLVKVAADFFERIKIKTINSTNQILN